MCLLSASPRRASYRPIVGGGTFSRPPLDARRGSASPHRSPYDPYNSQYSGLATASSDFRLGNWGGSFFKGAIDDLCVYKSALDPWEARS